MEQYIDTIIQSVILVGGLLSVISKLNTVLKNQAKQEVVIAEIKKDVHSNQEWGKDAKGKIDALILRTGDHATVIAGQVEKLNGLEKRSELVEALFTKNQN